MKRAAHIGRKRLKRTQVLVNSSFPPEIFSFSKKAEEACSSDIGTYYNMAEYYNAEDINFHIRDCNNLKLHIIGTVKAQWAQVQSQET
jgi:hypothetical protein